MEATHLVAGVALLAAFSSACCVVHCVIAMSRETLMHERSYGLAEQGGVGRALLRRGIPLMRPLVAQLFSVGRIEESFNGMNRLAASRHIVTTAENLCSISLVCLFGVFVLAALLSASVFTGALITTGVCVGVGYSLARRKDALTERGQEMIPDVLRSMGVCSHAGYSLQQTFEQVASETEPPIKPLFLRAVDDLGTGRTMDEALSSFRANALVTELAFVAVALDVQHKAGGSLRGVLDAARESVESELELKRSLKVQTAQAKFSARIVTLMPFMLIAVFSVLSPGFLDPFFATIEGVCLLGVAMVMQVTGILLVRRLLAVGTG